MEQLLTTEQAMKLFQIRDTRTMTKFRQRGLKCFKIGNKDYRYRAKDIEEFLENEIQVSQFEMIKTTPIKKKVKHRTIDLQKRRINLELNKVVQIGGITNEEVKRNNN